MIFSKFDVDKIRQDFPVLKQQIIYFDNACMSLKPRQVVDAERKYYEEFTACGGRSSHRLAAKVELELEKVRKEVQSFINAKSPEEIIFTRNTTEGINLVANSIGLKKGDEVVISDKEHNSNLIPWLKLKKNIGITLKVVDSNPDNTFNLENFEKALSEKTKLVSIVHTSNMDGVTNPIKEIAKIAHKRNILVMTDAAQSAPHKEIDVRELDVDFLAFSGHKMLGPTAIGVLYGKKEILEKMEQFIVGGETVIDSTYDSYVPEHLPMKFEAGLQHYAGIIGLGEAIRYLKKVGMKKIAEHEIKLNSIITEGLSKNPKIRILGPKNPELRGGIFSFVIEGVDIHHVSKMLDVSKGILTRSGAHCVHSWFNKHNMKGSVRASLYLYNTEEEARIFVEEVNKISKL